MRKPGLAALLFCALNTVAQSDTTTFMGSMPMKDGKVYYEAVITVDSLNASQLYARLKAFVYDSFRSGKDVIQQDDTVARVLRTAARIPSLWSTTLTGTIDAYLWHHLEISARDGRFKYTLTDFRVQTRPPHDNTTAQYSDDPLEQWNLQRPKNLEKTCAGFHADITAFIDRMIAAARTPTTAEEDW